MSDRRAIVLDVLALVSGVPRDSLRPEQDLVADLGLDSPKAVRLLVELEERLGAEIDDANLQSAANLLSGQTDPVRLMHCLNHVGRELPEKSIEHRDFLTFTP